MAGQSRINAILFDVDGTLIDTYRLYFESYRRALQDELGYLPEGGDFAERRPSSEKHFLAGWIGAERAAACHDAMCRHYEALHESMFDGIYDGVPEMLRALRSADLPLGVVTGKGRRAWEITTAKLDLGPFATVVTEDDVARPKPDPEGLRIASSAIGVPAEEIVYIGDSVGDMAAGREAGMRIGAALWPKTAPGEEDAFLDEIRAFEPEHTFTRPADVVRAFARWC